MNTSDQLELALTNLINQAISGTVGTVPEIISDLMLWHGLVSILYLVIGLTLAYIPYGIYKFIEYAKVTPLEDMTRGQREFFSSIAGKDKCELAFGLLYLLLVIASVVTIAILEEGLVWIKILITPYAWLFDYAIMLKG